MKIYGTVTTWFDKRRYGFIGRDDGQRDAFVHVDSTVDGQPLERGQHVEFELVEDPQGRPRAERVRRVNAPVQFGEGK